MSCITCYVLHRLKNVIGSKQYMLCTTYYRSKQSFLSRPVVSSDKQNTTGSLRKQSGFTSRRFGTGFNRFSGRPSTPQMRIWRCLRLSQTCAWGSPYMILRNSKTYVKFRRPFTPQTLPHSA